MIVPIFQIRKRRLKKVKHFTQGHTGRKGREIEWVTHYYQNAKCLISLIVQEIHNYSIQEVYKTFIQDG